METWFCFYFKKNMLRFKMKRFINEDGGQLDNIIQGSCKTTMIVTSPIISLCQPSFSSLNQASLMFSRVSGSPMGAATAAPIHKKLCHSTSHIRSSSPREAFSSACPHILFCLLPFLRCVNTQVQALVLATYELEF